MAYFVDLNRTFKIDRTGEVKVQPISVNPEFVMAIKPSNRLGYPEHRSTIYLMGGEQIDLADKYTAVVDKLG